MSWLFKRKQKKIKASTTVYGRHALSFEVLEPRLLLSADAFGGVVDAHDIAVDTTLHSNYDAIRDDLHSRLMLTSIHSADFTIAAEYSADESPILAAYQNQLDLSLLNHFAIPDKSVDLASIEYEVTKQLIFVDANTDDMELLLGGVAQDQNSHIIIIGENDNALELMTAEIQKYDGLESVHIISHGSSGSLKLGSETFDVNFFNDSDNQALFARWQTSMAEDADLLLYACNFAAGDAGYEALNRIAEVTGLNTAASDDITGGYLLDGNWQLERAVGVVDTSVVVSLDVQSIWQHSLATIVVNTTDDTSLRWGINNVTQLINSEAEISLREAIEAINKEGTWGTTVHTIEFNLDGDHTINLASQLPTLTRSLIIDGTTEADYNGIPVVKVNGAGNVFNLTGSNISISGLEISGGARGITISGNGNSITSCSIIDNGGYGIFISGASNTIGGDSIGDGNLISGNGDSGIRIDGASANNNVVEGNWIGLAADGETAYGNFGDGITINNSQGTHVTNNVISGNESHGVQIYRVGGTIPGGHTFLGNIVGLNASGDTALGNGKHGLQLFEVTNIHVGDGSASGRNIVSSNLGDGIIIIGANTTSVTISGNYIGTDITGTVDLGNEHYGVNIYDGPTTGGGGFGGWGPGPIPVWSASDYSRIYIGGDQVGEGNLISGNGYDGILVGKRATDVSIVNNLIGVDVSGKIAMGNSGNGISVTVGTESLGLNAETHIQNNIIAYNALDGIVVDDPNTYGVNIYKNSIFSNGDLSVDLGGDGLTPNDTTDFDSGANRLLNFPEISAVQIIGGELNIQGSLEYNANNQGNLTIYFYYSMEEGSADAAYAQNYIGTYVFSSGTQSRVTFNTTFDVEIPSGAFITASTFAPNLVGSSEFAPAVVLAQGNIQNEIATGSISISGSLIQGAMLASSHTIFDANGISNPLQYQWRRNGVAIDGANTDTYTLQQADVAQFISLDINFIDDQGNSESLSSATTGAVANLNDPVTGMVTIDGIRTEGQTLSANYSALSDIDGLPSSTSDYSFQWMRNGVDITGATTKTYVLVDDDVDANISVSVSYIDLLLSAEIKTSVATAGISNVNSLPVGSVTLNGGFTEDATLTAEIGFTDGDGITKAYLYQWYRDDVSIAGAISNTYLLGDSDVNSVINVSVSYQDDHGANEIVRSQNITAVSNINDIPQGRPAISGSNSVGSTLTAQLNFTDADGTTTSVYGYQWYRDGVAVTGAVSPTYMLTVTDIGAQMSVVVSYDDDGNHAEAVESLLTNPVTNTNSSPSAGGVIIVGDALEDALLTVSTSGLIDDDGLVGVTYSYQWYRNSVAIYDETDSTYLLADADVGNNIYVEISYVDNLGSSETVSSDVVGPIGNVNDAPNGTVSIDGSNYEGETLVVRFTPEDEDGVDASSYAFQWMRNGAATAGEILSSYVLTEADVKNNITVTVTYMDGHGTVESQISDVFGPIQNVNQLPNGTVAITSASGLFQEDEVLTAEFLSLTDSDGLPAVFSYQWLRDGVNIASATSQNYRLTDADVNHSLTVLVTYTDLNLTDEFLMSDPTNSIANVEDLPTGTLEINGSAQEGRRLTVTNNVTDDDGIASVTGYQWYRDSVAIAGATENTYVLQNDDVKSLITVSWQYTDTHGVFETVVSDPTSEITNVNSSPNGAVIIAGTPTEDEVISVSQTITDADGMAGVTLNYQWYRDGVVIAAETGTTFQLSDADLYSTLHVIVSYTDLGGTNEIVISNGFTVVNAVNDAPTGELAFSGNFYEGELITVLDGVVDVDGVPPERTYTWYREGQAVVSGTETSYILSQADVGSQISVSLTYTDLQGFDEVFSSELSAVVGNVNDAPQGSIRIAGVALEGTLLTIENTVTDADGLPNNVSYQWYRDSVAISGAVGASYMLDASDIGGKISVSLSYTDLHGTDENIASSQTNIVAWVNHPAIGDLSITGDYAVGSILTLHHDIRDSDGLPITYQYQWQRDGIDIVGENRAIHQIGVGDQGRTLSVLISFVDGRGFDEVLVSPLMDIPSLNIPALNITSNAGLGYENFETSSTTPIVSSQSPELESNAGSDSEDSDTSDETGFTTKSVTFNSHSNNIFDRSEGLSTMFDPQGNSENKFIDVDVIRSNQNSNAANDIGSISAVWSSTVLTSVGGGIADLNSMMTILNTPEYNDRLGESIKAHEEANITFSNTVVGGTAAASTGLSVGYLLWTLRSGVLMTSLLSSLPAWRFIDPLPILGGSKGEENDDESLESMVASNPSTTPVQQDTLIQQATSVQQGVNHA